MRFILRNSQSPGDIVMLTAAVRDLHRSNPGKFVTDVRTPCGHLWENSPYITPLREDEPGVEVIDCHYPLVHESNTGPWHFVHGFSQFLSARLGVPIRPAELKGDLYISALEKTWFSQVQEITGEDTPFWIIVAGGKYDFTAKWWALSRFQEVVDYFAGKILFVQVGEQGHYHPPLDGVLDLRGKTDLRQLVRLVYHSQGVLCPVTLAMHLAAAIETKPGMPKNRPCVVVAGGREPAQWEAYPHHQYIHTNGALRCCEQGGCWKARTAPVGDGDSKDWVENLCVDVVFERGTRNSERGARGAVRPNLLPRLVSPMDQPPLVPGAAISVPCAAASAECGVRKAEGEGQGSDEERRNALSYPQGDWAKLLPRCMDLITAEEVIRRVELYFDGGAVRYLDAEQWNAPARALAGREEPDGVRSSANGATPILLSLDPANDGEKNHE